MSDKIEGVPEGYELIKFGIVKEGDLFINDCGCVQSLVGVHWNSLIFRGVVRKIEPPKPLIIEAGKWYRLRGGDIVGPIKRCDYGRFIWTNGYVTWTDKGSNYIGKQSEADIVEEVPSPEPPKPVYVPWTYETCPVGLLVKVRVGKQKGLITGVGGHGARVGATSSSYDCLLSDWIQLDGTPCGTVEVQG